MGESKQGQRIPELRGHLGANVIKIVYLLADAVSKKEGGLTLYLRVSPVS
jgi:hypothetical protein